MATINFSCLAILIIGISLVESHDESDYHYDSEAIEVSIHLLVWLFLMNLFHPQGSQTIVPSASNHIGTAFIA